MLSEQAIREHVAQIEQAVNRVAANHATLADFLEIAERFDILRNEYRAQPTVFSGIAVRLAELRKAFDQSVANRLPEIVDRYHAVTAEVHKIEREKELWRGCLITMASDSGETRIDGANAIVRVRATESATIPRVGTPERGRLEILVRESGQWEQVSQLSPAKLQRALADNVFPATAATEVRAVCPRTVRYQVVSRPAGPAN